MKTLKKKHIETIRPLLEAFQIELGLEVDINYQMQNIRNRMGEGSFIVSDSKKEPTCFAWVSVNFTSINLKKVAFIKAQYVSKDSRRKGLGSKLLEAIKKKAKEEGAEYIIGASRNDPSKRLMEKAGGVVDEVHYKIDLKDEQ